MFTELMPFLAHRTVLITVARENDTILPVNVLPKRANESENAALTTPLSFAVTPEELDHNFARELAVCVDVHQRLGSSPAGEKAAMDAAAKAVHEESRRVAEERRKSKTSTFIQASAPLSGTAELATAAINGPEAVGNVPNERNHFSRAYRARGQ